MALLSEASGCVVIGRRRPEGARVISSMESTAASQMSLATSRGKAENSAVEPGSRSSSSELRILTGWPRAP